MSTPRHTPQSTHTLTPSLSPSLSPLSSSLSPSAAPSLSLPRSSMNTSVTPREETPITPKSESRPSWTTTRGMDELNLNPSLFVAMANDDPTIALFKGILKSHRYEATRCILAFASANRESSPNLGVLVSLLNPFSVFFHTMCDEIQVSRDRKTLLRNDCGPVTWIISLLKGHRDTWINEIKKCMESHNPKPKSKRKEKPPLSVTSTIVSVTLEIFDIILHFAELCAIGTFAYLSLGADQCEMKDSASQLRRLCDASSPLPPLPSLSPPSSSLSPSSSSLSLSPSPSLSSLSSRSLASPLLSPRHHIRSKYPADDGAVKYGTNYRSYARNFQELGVDVPISPVPVKSDSSESRRRMSVVTSASSHARNREKRMSNLLPFAIRTEREGGREREREGGRERERENKRRASVVTISGKDDIIQNRKLHPKEREGERERERMAKEKEREREREREKEKVGSVTDRPAESQLIKDLKESILQKNDSVTLHLLSSMSPSDLDSCDSKGWTVLHSAAKYGNLSILKTLLTDHAPNVLSCTDTGCLAIHFFCSRTFSEDDSASILPLLRLLAPHPSAFAWPNEDRETPLHYAMMSLRVTSLGVTRMLIDRGGDASISSWRGHTPLYYARQCAPTGKGFTFSCVFVFK